MYNRKRKMSLITICCFVLLLLCAACSAKKNDTMADGDKITEGTEVSVEMKTGDEATTTKEEGTTKEGGTTKAAEETTAGETAEVDGTTTEGAAAAEEITTAAESTTEAQAYGTEAESAQEAENTEAGKKVAENIGAGAPEGSPYALHGRLSVEGARLVDEHGEVYQIKGVSTHGIGWFPQYVNKETFAELEGWGADAVRLAMYTAEGGYCEGGDSNKQRLEELVDTGVTAAVELGMYVVIDWHVLNDRDPWVYADQAEDFFGRMSEKYKDCGNVIYEICNEPNGGVDWSSVKSYAERIIPVIRANAPEAVIIVGTPTWSQDIDKAMADPVTDYENIMYALHFYADTHRDYLWDRMKTAVDAGFPVIVSEFGICDASGNGQNNYDEGNKWIEAMDEYGVSCFIWNLSNKAETSALIASGSSRLSGFTDEDLSDSGRWYREILGK